MNTDVRAVVINLARSRDRRTYMDAQLENSGLSYEFFEAVDGTKLTPAERALYDDKRMKHLFGRAMSNTEIACALSHIRVYEWMIKEKIARLMVFEDDVCLRPVFFKALGCVDNWVPHDWDMVDFSNPDLIIIDSQTIPLGCRLYPLAFLPYTSLFRCLSIRLTNCAYMLTYAAAQRLLELAYPIRMPADELKGRTYLNQLKMYTLFPALTTTHFLTSTIEETRVKTLLRNYKQEPIYARIVRFVRIHIHAFGVCMGLGLRYPSVRREWPKRILRFCVNLLLKVMQKVVRPFGQ